MKQAMIKYIQNKKNDELYTPMEAVNIILDYIPKGVNTIWECTAIKDSNIAKVLKQNGYNVICSHIKDGKSFFDYEPEKYDIIITNPPYSIKDKFLERAFKLGKPFMFLLPTTALEGKKRISMYKRYGGIQLIIPNKRINFMDNKKGVWFHTSWFCFKCNLKKDLTFIEL